MSIEKFLIVYLLLITMFYATRATQSPIQIGYIQSLNINVFYNVSGPWFLKGHKFCWTPQTYAFSLDTTQEIGYDLNISVVFRVRYCINEWKYTVLVGVCSAFCLTYVCNIKKLIEYFVTMLFRFSLYKLQFIFDLKGNCTYPLSLSQSGQQ